MPTIRLNGLLSPAQIPGPPPMSWLRGILQMVRFERDPIAYLRTLHQTYGDLAQICDRDGRRIFFALGPEYNRLLHADTERFVAKGFVIRGPRDSAQRRLATSLFTMNGERHKRHRHLLLPAFQKSALALYRADLVELLHQELDRWQPGQAIDLLHEMRRWSWNIAGKLLYGLDVSDASESLRDDIDRWVHRNASACVRMLRRDWPLTPYRRLLRHAERLERKIVAMRRAKDAADCQGHDVLSLLMRTRDEDGQALTDAELVGHAMTLFLAAFETTANTLTWTLFLLAQHPDVQADVLDELSFLHGGAPTVEQLNCLPLLDGVLKESMRLMPAVVLSRRISTVDGPIGPYFLPRKSRIFFSHYLTHHMPELYPEPERFRPERWWTINPSPAEFLPFGAGPRYCIGASFAQFVLKTALAMTLPRWRLTVAPNARVDRHVVVAMAPRYGMPMTVAPQDRQFEVSCVRGNIHEMVDLTPRPVRAVVRQPLQLAA
jgi:cytochrome P450